MNAVSAAATSVALPVVDVELLNRLAQAGGHANEPLQLLARLAADADSSGLVPDFSLSALARRCGYGPSGRRTLAGYLRPLIAAGAVDYRPARGPAPGHCTIRLAPPPGTRALIRAPQTRRADFCPSDQHIRRAPLKGFKAGEGTPPLPPQAQSQRTRAANQALGGGNDEHRTPPSTALVDSIVDALPPAVRDLPRLAKDGGGWHCLALVTAELAELLGEHAAIAAVTANPPTDLRSPVAWLLARARQLRDQATAAQGDSEPEAPNAPMSSSRQTDRVARAAADAGQRAVEPGEPPATAHGAAGALRGSHLERSAPLSPVPKSPGVGDALAAVAALTVAGPWRDQLLAAATGQVVPTNSTVRSLALAIDEALATAPQLTGRGLVVMITNRIMPSDVKDLPGLLAARARALTASATAKPHPSGVKVTPLRPGRDRGCPSCEGSSMVLTEEGSARPCPTCRPNATVSSSPRRQAPSGDSFAIGDLLPHRVVPSPNQGGSSQCNPTVRSSAS